MSPDGLLSALARQQQAHPNSIELGLDRVSAVARRLSVLPWKTPTIIVGGTNGKGSTSSYIAAFAQAAGARTGLFTSPHLRRYQERIAIDGMPVDDCSLLAAFADIEAARGAYQPDFFRVQCAGSAVGLPARVASIWRCSRSVSAAGSTPPISSMPRSPCCARSRSIIPSGSVRTVESIGREKAGIFRPGRPVVLGSEAMPAVRAWRNCATARGPAYFQESLPGSSARQWPLGFPWQQPAANISAGAGPARTAAKAECGHRVGGAGSIDSAGIAGTEGISLVPGNRRPPRCCSV